MCCMYTRRLHRVEQANTWLGVMSLIWKAYISAFCDIELLNFQNYKLNSLGKKCSNQKTSSVDSSNRSLFTNRQRTRSLLRGVLRVVKLICA